MSWDQLSSHAGEEGWENSIRVTDFGVFIHKAEDAYWLGGCKGMSCGDAWIEPDGEPFFNDSEKALGKVRGLYNEADGSEGLLTGDKFLLRTNSTAVFTVSGMVNDQNVYATFETKAGAEEFIDNMKQTYDGSNDAVDLTIGSSSESTEDAEEGTP